MVETLRGINGVGRHDLFLSGDSKKKKNPTTGTTTKTTEQKTNKTEGEEK